MTPSPETISPETIARMRQQYADGVPVARIRAENGVTKGVLYRWLDGGPSGSDQLPPIARRRVFASLTIGRNRSLVTRLWRTARRQVHEIEQRLARAGQPPAEREGDARMLAVLVKTLRELAALDKARADAGKSGTQTRIDHEDDDPIPQDIDELRRELARRVDILRQRRAAAGPSDGDQA